MTDKENFFTRRRLVKGIGVTAGVGAIGGASLVYSSQPALAAFDDTDGGDVTVETTDGDISDVSVTPDLTVEWGDFNGGVSGFDITVSAGTADNDTSVATDGELTGVSDTATGVDTFSVQGTDATLTDTSGTVDIGLALIDLVGQGNALSSGDLPVVSEEGGSADMTVHSDIEVAAHSNNGATTETATVSGSFVVTVDDTGGTSSVSAVINADASE